MSKLQKKPQTITPEKSIYLNRQKKLKIACSNFKVSYFFTSSKNHLRYLTGYHGSNGLFVLTPSDTIFVTDSRYESLIEKNVFADKKFIGSGNLLDIIYKNNIFKGKEFIGFNPSTIKYSDYEFVKKNKTSQKLIGLPFLIEKLMAIKTQDEINKIKKAVKITDLVFEKILKIISPNTSEHDISAEITYQHQKLGAECDAFPPIIAIAKRSALPHSHPTNKKLTKGELILDFGCRFDGYNSDLTRTVYIGKTPKNFKENYNFVLEAQQKTIEQLKIGMKGCEVDSIARNYLKEKKLDKYFTHSVGHGLSLDVHAFPRLSKTSNDILQKNNVITIEPGIYFKNNYGIRIEDDILVSDKPEILNKSTKNLIEL
ncbi:MAG: aminopeptidase P family protein [Bacteroidetes bacterium]|nr:aminopeptidase P family protein [Bacteroidota bacterium]